MVGDAFAQFGVKHVIVVGFKLGNDTVVLFAFERFYFFFAFDDKSYGNALYTPGRERRLDFLPEHGRKFEADDSVEHASRLLSVDAVDVDVARVFDSVKDSVFSDFVKDDSPRFLRSKSEHFVEVPGDSLTFAVFIGSEPYHVGFLGFSFKGFYEFFLVGGYFVNRLIVVVDVNAEFFLFQVADVTVT